MNTQILLIRHAQSIANENVLFGGITDYTLSKSGQIQANSLVKRLEKYEIEKIYSSPLKRAIQTISHSANVLNKEIFVDDNLIEINVGAWEKQLRDELRKNIQKQINILMKLNIMLEWKLKKIQSMLLIECLKQLLK